MISINTYHLACTEGCALQCCSLHNVEVFGHLIINPVAPTLLLSVYNVVYTVNKAVALFYNFLSVQEPHVTIVTHTAHGW